MERIEMLEQLSDKIRQGEPVGIFEAIACINYQKARQETIKAEKRANSWWERLKRYLKQ